MMRLSLIAGAFLALAGVFPAKAQEYRVNNPQKQTFIVSVNKARSGHSVGVDSTFCPATNGVIHGCKTLVGSSGFSPMLAGGWSRRAGERKYDLSFAHGKLRKPAGRYYFTEKLRGNHHYSIGNITYFADLAPGTVVVFPTDGLPMEEAIAYAKELMAQKIGEDILSLRFIPGGAVAVDCDKSSKKLSCKVGKQASLSSVSFR